MARQLLRVTIIGLAAALAVGAAALSLLDPHHLNSPSARSHVPDAVLSLGALVLVAVGGRLWLRRPHNRGGPLLLAFSASGALLQGTYFLGRTPLPTVGVRVAVLTFRSLSFWSILAWPSGRLRRVDARGLALYTAAMFATGVPGWLLYGPRSSTAPLAVVSLPTLANAAAGMGNLVVMPLGAVWVLTVVWRRLREAGRTAQRPPANRRGGHHLEAAAVEQADHSFTDQRRVLGHDDPQRGHLHTRRTRRRLSPLRSTMDRTSSRTLENQPAP